MMRDMKPGARAGTGRRPERPQYGAPNIDGLLSRLEGVRQSGPDRWMARCPAHEDRSPSLSVRKTEDGTLLLYCFAGCGAADIVAAIGLELTDLFPPRAPGSHHQAKRPEQPRFNSSEVVRLAVTEGLICGIACRDVRAGKILSDEEARRVDQAQEILLKIYAGVGPWR